MEFDHLDAQEKQMFKWPQPIWGTFFALIQQAIVEKALWHLHGSNYSDDFLHAVYLIIKAFWYLW